MTQAMTSNLVSTVSRFLSCELKVAFFLRNCLSSVLLLAYPCLKIASCRSIIIFLHVSRRLTECVITLTFSVEFLETVSYWNRGWQRSDERDKSELLKMDHIRSVEMWLYWENCAYSSSTTTLSFDSQLVRIIPFFTMSTARIRQERQDLVLSWDKFFVLSLSPSDASVELHDDIPCAVFVDSVTHADQWLPASWISPSKFNCGQWFESKRNARIIQRNIFDHILLL